MPFSSPRSKGIRSLALRKQRRLLSQAESSHALATIPADNGSEIARRKSEHIDIVLDGDVAARDTTSGFERIRFVHCALPELDCDSIDLSTTFVGRRMRAPFIVSSMTGGPLHAQRINRAIAEAAGLCGVGFAVGSQRIALERKGWAGFGRELRALAGNVPILANFGAAQLKGWDGAAMASRAMEMIEADALIIHLNPLQEAVQRGGDRDWSGILGRIEDLVRRVDRPIIVKEVGAGISGAVARQLWNAGVRIIDAAGAGGTSWAAVEAKRSADARWRNAGEAFRDWGIPTAEAISAVRAACPEACVIGSGGVRNGVDAAKAIRLGADVVGQAAALLPQALTSTEALAEHIGGVVEQLRIACFCTASANLASLRRAPIEVSGKRGGSS